MISDTRTGKPVIVLGAGGHARVVIDALRLSGREVIGYVAPAIGGQPDLKGIKNLGDDESLIGYSADKIELANGVGAMPGNIRRRELDDQMAARGFSFTRVIHPSAIIGDDVEIDEGAQIMAGVIMQPSVKIGRSTIVNTGVIVDHDCVIDRDCHLAPGVTLSGNVVVNQRTHIGTGASIIQGIVIGQDCVVAAGAIIYRDISENTKYVPQPESDLLKE